MEAMNNDNLQEETNLSTNNAFFRSSINYLPADQSKFRHSSIPISFTVEFDREPLEILEKDLIRCFNCNGYINCYSEIIMPGLKWKCNLCNLVNEVSVPFQMKQTNVVNNGNVREFNSKIFSHPFLLQETYELEAPASFVVKTPDPPVLIFLIEVTSEAKKLTILSSVLYSIKEILKSNNYHARTKIAFVFYSESVYILTSDLTFSVITGQVPTILSDFVTFPITQFRTDNEEYTGDSNGVRFDDIIEYFKNKGSIKNNLLAALRVISRVFRSGTVFTFLGSAPNHSFSRIEQSNSLICTNKFYKETAEMLFRKNLAVNLFIMTRSSVEYSTMKILTQSGGQTFHYSNYDGTDPIHTSKLYCDLNEYFSSRVCFGGVCRIRTNENISLKAMHGNFIQKGVDLFGYSNFNSAHSINFEVEIIGEIKEIYIQLAMIRVNKQCRRTIRVFTIRIPHESELNTVGMDLYNTPEIAKSLFLNACYKESLKKRSGAMFLDSSLKSIIGDSKSYNGLVPDSMKFLPLYVLSLKKSIPFRPDPNTPTDFRAFYIYLLCNSHTKIVDLMIYPMLVNLTSDTTVLPLTRQNIRDDGIYLLDAGINVFLFIGKDNETYSQFIDGDLVDGVCLFDNFSSNEFGNYINELLAFFLDDRIVKPRFIMVNNKVNSVYSDIFFSYMYNDNIYGLPCIEDYENALIN